MNEEYIKNLISQEISNRAISSLDTPAHVHNGVDSPKLDAGASLIGTPQNALTTSVGGSLTSGGVGNLSNADNVILTNLITRVSDLENRLQNLRLIK